MMPHHDSRAIANAFIDLASAKGDELTHMALQKLVYIAHGWNFAFNDGMEDNPRPLISDEIEAWDWGPVIPNLWDSLKRYGNRTITDHIHAQEWRSEPENRGPVIREPLSEEEQNIINLVYDAYGHMTGGRLSEITHEKGTPWSEKYQPGVRHIKIPNDLIADHYRKLRDDLAA